MIDKTMVDSLCDWNFVPLESVNHQSVSIPDEIEQVFQQHYGFLPEEHWKQFEFDFPELSDIDDIFNEIQTVNPSPKNQCIDDVLYHDCMWAGHCSSKKHAEEPKSTLKCIVPTPPVIKTEPTVSVTNKPVGTGQQQSLLKPSVKAANTTTITNTNTTNFIQHTPQTPPESDDEEHKGITLLKILNDAINECDLEEDTELCDYFEEKDIKEEQIEIKEEPIETSEASQEDEAEISYKEEYRIRTQLAAENDHSYHKDKNAAMLENNNYGLETPSDSEEDEEIDVVSVTEKLSLSLPTNPSSKDRQKLQRKMATAISRKQINNRIKTILPVRHADDSSPSTSSGSPYGKSSNRGVKRGRGTRNNNGYKRRRTNMEGEIEPCDKRHLHNDMERQRRVDLRIAFENLKGVIPDVSGTKKIAKVNILLQAAQYCYHLTGTNSSYVRQLDELRKKQAWLRSRVSQLRRNLAARR